MLKMHQAIIYSRKLRYAVGRALNFKIELQRNEFRTADSARYIETATLNFPEGEKK